MCPTPRLPEFPLAGEKQKAPRHDSLPSLVWGRPHVRMGETGPSPLCLCAYQPTKTGAPGSTTLAGPPGPEVPAAGRQTLASTPMLGSTVQMPDAGYAVNKSSFAHLPHGGQPASLYRTKPLRTGDTMKKLALSIEALEVETFEPVASEKGETGSVVAHLNSWNPYECVTYDPRDYRCYFSEELGGGECTPVCHSGGAATCDTIDAC